MATEVSIVIPVYNEERILTSAVRDLCRHLEPYGWSYELLLAENGSVDATVSLAEALASELPAVRLIRVGEPNYGKALRAGILQAQGTYVICEEIDLCDVAFHAQALELLRANSADMVIGSKLLAGSTDERPFMRHAASIAYTTLLRACLGFRGSDTHGLKAFRREALLETVRACVVDKDVFASEFVIRAYRAGLRIKEVPIRLLEKRPPSINLFKRVPNVLKNLGKLTWAIRVKG